MGELIETKRCSTCKEVLPRHTHFSRAAGGRSRCKKCSAAKALEKSRELKTQPGYGAIRDRLNTLRRIRDAAKRAGTYVSPRGNDAKTVEYRKKYQTLRRYGISWAEYCAMREAQQGLCKACGQVESEKNKLVIDHCHDTGRIRGLLCDRCNRGIGAFGDSIELLRLATLFLERTKLEQAL